MAAPGGSAGPGGWATPDCNTSTYSNGKMGPNIREQASYWTTPDVCSGARDMSKIDPEAQRRADTKRTTGLPTEVAMWATPTGSENSNRTTQIAPSHGISHGLVLAGQAASWPTPNSTDAEHSGRVNSGGGQIHLPDAVNNWPTPAARDGKGTNSVDHMNRTDGRTDGRSRNHADQLPNFVMMNFSHPVQPTPDGEASSPETQNSRRHLNPLFGAWLMGWPSTWTIAEPHASSASATELWRSALQQRLSCLLGDQPTPALRKQLQNQ
jgi:hypothetical protein